MEILTQYYGVDWLASIFAVLMIYYLGNKNPLGFVFGIGANLSWIGFAIQLRRGLVNLHPVFYYQL